MLYKVINLLIPCGNKQKIHIICVTESSYDAKRFSDRLALSNSSNTGCFSNIFAGDLAALEASDLSALELSHVQDHASWRGLYLGQIRLLHNPGVI